MKKTGFLDTIRVTSPCSQDWEEMRGSDKVRFCEHCAHEVNNFSALTRKQAMRLVRESEGRICARYVKNPDTGAPIFADRLYQITRRVGIAAGVLGASLTLSTLAYAQGDISAAPPVKQTETTPENKAEKDKTESLTGTISITVKDPTGAIIPNVPITLFNEKTGEQRSATSDENGYYEFKAVAAGTYSLKAKGIGGFTDYEVRAVEVRENLTTALDIPMEVRYAMMGLVAIAVYEHPLFSAVSNEDFEEVKNLIAKGASVTAKDKNYGDMTALHVAVNNGSQEIAKYLLDMGAKINARDKQRRTPLMSVDDDATPELVRMLLDHRAKVNAFDTEGNTTLIFVAEYDKAEVLRVLLDAGANVNAQNKEGTTALMKAAENSYLENVKVLLEAGADANLRNKEGKTALDLTDNEEIQELLKPSVAKE